MTLSCFDLGEQMLSVEAAREALLTLVPTPLGHERVPLSNAYGRYLAAPIVADIDVPAHTNAAMDGIALAWRDAQQTHWPVAGTALAGHVFAEHVPAGSCVRITTGAALPKGTDTVIMREQLTQSFDGASVEVAHPERVRRGQHVRQAGEDMARGSIPLAAGTRLGAAASGLAAALGQADVCVYRRPSVALFSTGDEVTAPGEPLPAGGVYDANRFTLRGLLQQAGAEVVDLGILPDDREAITQALEQAMQSDLILTSGGVSMGQADVTRQALSDLGRLAFWRVALRPGRPLACGWLGKARTPFVGLPGNPVAVMVTFTQFVAPLLARFQGQPHTSPKRLLAVADEALTSRVERTDFLRGVYYTGPDGRLRVRSTGAQGSGVLTSMLAANCLIEIAEARDTVRPGEVVDIQPLIEGL